MPGTRNGIKNKKLNKSNEMNSNSFVISKKSNEQLNPQSNLQSLRNEQICSSPRSPMVSDHVSSTRMWLNLSDKIDRQNKLICELKNSMVECKESLMKEFESKFESIRDEIADVKAKMSEFEKVATEMQKYQCEVENLKQKLLSVDEIDTDFKNIKNVIGLLKSKVQKQENATVAADVRINGIPCQNNENLINIFNAICHTINTPVPSLQSIVRLQNQNNKFAKDSPDAVIIVKMLSPYDKNYFMKSMSLYKKANKNFSFCLRHIGLDSDSKFFINENLTQENYKILQASLRLKRQNELCSAFTIRGNVYVKKDMNEKAVLVEEIGNLSNLDELFREAANIQRND